MRGKRPAIETANTVMASALRASGVRQGALNRIEDGGNEGAGVGDSDPEDEIDQIGAPHDGMVDAGDAQAGGDLIPPAERTRQDPGDAERQQQA